MDDLTLPDIAALAAPVYFAFLVFEIIIIVRFRRAGGYERRDTVASLLMGTGSILSGILLASTVLAAIGGLYTFAYQYRLFDLGTSWWVFVLAFVLGDLVYYWVHRLEHEVRWGWASHVVHHSSQHYNFSTALRQSWFKFATGTFLLSVPVAWIGVHPAIIAFSLSLNLFYQFFVHTETVGRLHPWIEAIFNTPSHHRVHHGNNVRYLDANYAGTLIVWDRLFGTFVPEDDDEPVRYGLVKDIGTFNPLRIAVHEYVGIARDVFMPGLSLKERLGYMFGPPGWSHDGSRQTSRQMKAGEA
ncbi:MAG: sterol desaturase family protein [Pseudomonadota bacterium]